MSEIKLSYKRWEKLARQQFNPGPRENCVVCDKYQSLAQAHHIIPLFVQYKRNYIFPIHDFVWLCPTHHCAVHLFISQSEAKRLKGGKELINLICELPEEEFKKVFVIFERYQVSA